ncbi:uroporphyrinogen decarboxylase [Flammeovirga aprica JL-4]|uniref:Uroporphyrinogen decarboxylase n=1 Tax=Flammeovirga aprica JL-4 TaxID=694437 RepID=A0A7X9RWI1_9BACT|nr:uroporphyrinogen decarboxylase [Flammeovirga aprica JL-4]
MEFSPEYVGYLASLLLMISFALKNVKLLRMVNTVGCIVFVIYGIMLSAWPIVITNGFIAAINIFYLVKDKK